MRRHTTTMMRGALCLALLAAAACGVDAREGKGPQAVFREDPMKPRASHPDAPDPEAFEWPQGPRPRAVLEIAGYGQIHIDLYPELAPRTVENFRKLTSEGFYDGTTFHRVIAGFMIQGGDPNTRDDDPRNDGRGGREHAIDDEFSDAPHIAGVVAMANTGSPNSSGPQFFIVHEHTPRLDGSYSVFGRVVAGLGHVDAIASVETDVYGRWGPRDRPIENVTIERAWIERAGSAASEAAADPAASREGGRPAG